MPWVTGAAILQHVAASGTPSADPQDTAWAGICATAVDAAITDRLDDGALTPTTAQTAQLTATALQDGAALYVARKAPHGVLSIGPDGDVARLGSAILRASDPILRRISPGIG